MSLSQRGLRSQLSSSTNPHSFLLFLPVDKRPLDPWLWILTGGEGRGKGKGKGGRGQFEAFWCFHTLLIFKYFCLLTSLECLLFGIHKSFHLGASSLDLNPQPLQAVHHLIKCSKNCPNHLLWYLFQSYKLYHPWPSASSSLPP